MIKKLITLAALSIGASTAMAQASNFTGLSGALSFNLVNASTKLKADGATVNFGESSSNVGGQIAFGQAINPTTILTVGASLGVGSIKAGSGGFDGEDFTIKAKNMFSLYLEPGFLVADTTLVYGKVAYSSLKGQMRVVGEASESETFSGFGFGGGIRTMLNNHSYIQVEVLQTSFGKEGGPSFNVTPSITMGSIGYGIKF